MQKSEFLGQERCNILIEYARGDVLIGFLQRRYPFIAKEVERQGLSKEDLKTQFRVQN